MNLKLDSNTWDIIIGRGAERVEGVEFTAQMVRSRLQTVLGEWEPVPTLGMPWFDSVFTKAIDISIIQSLVVDEIRKVAHVIDVTTMDLNLDKRSRMLYINFTAMSDWGEISDTITVEA